MQKTGQKWICYPISRKFSTYKYNRRERERKRMLQKMDRIHLKIYYYLYHINFMRIHAHSCAFIYSFPYSKGESWQNIFPACTTTHEIALVDGLVRYNPKKRLTAAEVHRLLYLIGGFSSSFSFPHFFLQNSTATVQIHHKYNLPIYPSYCTPKFFFIHIMCTSIYYTYIYRIHLSDVFHIFHFTDAESGVFHAIYLIALLYMYSVLFI